MADAPTHAFGSGRQVPRAARRVFGPVDSRRLGRSLGIDLLPHKTCSLDCVYCECGRTTDLRVSPEEFFPTSEVIAELDAILPEIGPLDSVTFSGSGEPLLHAGIGAIVRHLKRHHPTRRTTILTNGTQLREPAVRTDILEADVVVPSLDSATQAGFSAICRPHGDIRVQDVVDGISAFRREYKGLLHLEIFLVPGVNDTPQELQALREAVERIQPDQVQLNRLDRPGTVSGIANPADAELERIAAIFAPTPVRWTPTRHRQDDAGQEEKGILSALSEKPLTVAEISARTGLREGDAAKLLRRLVDRHRLAEIVGEGHLPDRYALMPAQTRSPPQSFA